MQWIRNPKDFYSGLLFIAFGVAALVISQPYTLGTAARMGPGYFPRILGTLLVVLGAVLCLVGGRRAGEERPQWHLRPLLTVLVSVSLFALFAQWLGLIITSVLLVVVSSWAGEEFKWKEALVSGLVQGVASVVIFVYGLTMPLEVWPTFLSGVR
jgi:hypothetical protein